MRLLYTTAVLLGLIFMTPVTAQESGDKVLVGEILEIGVAKNYQYTHLNLPKANFIIKTGGIANYDQLAGVLVEITEVKTDNRDNVKVILKRKDGKKFFNSFPQIKADYKKAIASKELLKK